MKKLISMSLLLILVLGMMPFAAFAGEAPESVTVYVTIVGQPAEMKDVDTVGVKHEAITVTDKDGDGALTINDALYAALSQYVADKGVKTGFVMWPIRTAVSGKQMTPGGATELMELLGKEESIRRIRIGIDKLNESAN